VSLIKYNVIVWSTGEVEAGPYRYLDRALMRAMEWNIVAQAPLYSIQPVRVRES
jgi:hypothetical protein